MKKTLLLMLLCVAPLSALPSFVGTWTVDEAASDSMDELMAAQGFSSLERAALAHVKETVKIEQSPAEMVITTITPVTTDVVHMALDGTPRTREVFHIGKVTSRSTWEGETLVTRSELTAGDGKPAHGTLKRRLADGVLVQDITLELSDHRVLKARRRYRRI